MKNNRRLGTRKIYGARGKSDNGCDNGVDASGAARSPEPIRGEHAERAPQKTSPNSTSGFYAPTVRDWKEQ